ncbi:MAG: endonuclease/exonuclease/phosphatase family protein [Flavobacteriales bacterium]|nr:endonuclease/exonuclease/phosphatase family protein [Flavobacteriales bacterium]
MLIKSINWLTLLACYLVVCIPDYFLVALLRSFTVQIACASFVIGIYYFGKQNHIHYGIAVTSIVLCFATFTGAFIKEDVLATDSDTFTVAHFNVLKFNNKFDSVINSALETDADIISFQETNAIWDFKLRKKLSNKYPYVISVPKEACCYGLSVFSKTKISNGETTFFGGHPNLVGDIELNDTTVHFVCSHTAAPTSNAGFENRNQHIKEISSYVSNLDQPVLVIGDFNSVPWDINIQGFKSRTGLIDSRTNICPTYPAWLKIGMIPIDFIFHSEELTCTEFNNIDTTSSDHYGVIGQYNFKAI